MSGRYGPYSGSGKVYMRPYGSTTVPLDDIGNCSLLEPGVEEERKDQQDYTQAGGGLYASFSRIKSVSFKATLHDLNPLNVARALFGSSTAVVSGTVTDEAVTFRKGGLVRLAKPASAVTTVKNTAGSTTYVAGTDYIALPEGLYIPATSNITDDSTGKVTYTSAAYDQIEAVTVGATDYEVIFAGLNEANGNKSMIVDFWRVQLSPAQKLSLITPDFASLELSGRVLKDTTKPNTGGLSQYMRVYAGA